MLWHRPLPEPRGMPRRSSPRPLTPPNPRRPERRPGARWQEPARPTDDDRYSSFPPFFWCEGSLAATVLQARSFLSSTRFSPARPVLARDVRAFTPVDAGYAHAAKHNSDFAHGARNDG